MKQIVIEVPEEDYENKTLAGYFGAYSKQLDDVIYNGTPLPDGHGKLIDAKEYENSIRKHYFDNHTVIRCTEIALYAATPVIEADIEGEEQEMKSKGTKKRGALSDDK